MKTLTCNLGPQFSYPNFRFHFPSLSRENPNLLNFSHRKWLYHPKILTLCSTITSDSLSYGGWDDPRLGGGSVHSGESNQLRNLDKRYIFVYLLGFVCALAISRVRVSSTVAFPACVIVFAVGFSIGFVNGGHVSELSLIGTTKRLNDEKIRVSIKKLRNLMDFLSGFDGKINNLINGIRRGIGSNHITVDDLESYIKVMESFGLSNLKARSVVEACTDTMLVENQEVERNLNQKLSRRNKEVGETGFDLLQFIGGLIRGNSVVDEKVSSSVFNDNLGNRNAAISGYTRNKLDMANEARRINLFVHDQMKIADMGNSAKRVLDREQYNNQQISLKTGHHNEVETWASHDNFPDSVDFHVNLKQMKTEASFEQERILHKTNGSYREDREKEIYKTHSREEERLISEDDPSHNSDIGSFPSSTVSDDIVFDSDLVLIQKRRKVLKGLYDQVTSKDEIATVLVNVSEECEELLVEAGGKYRLALSTDGNDTGALYNWGLALSFCAQLIADIGPLSIVPNTEAAVDADKIFLAAIDKFDAMMSKSNVYTPDALYRWGVALQQRSRLPPGDSKEKVKLLQQATRLYQDALDIDSDNLQVTEALYSCISVLNFRR
ncbi:hypothetical protein ACSBR2_015739 [Camellia fascicularis]